MSNYEPPNPYDTYDGEELPFITDDVWEDGDRAYDEMVDEAVLAGHALKREEEIDRLRREVTRLDNENAALRKMLTAAALQGRNGW